MIKINIDTELLRDFLCDMNNDCDDVICTYCPFDDSFKLVKAIDNGEVEITLDKVVTSLVKTNNPYGGK